jgi:hypothetical protein
MRVLGDFSVGSVPYAANIGGFGGDIKPKGAQPWRGALLEISSIMYPEGHPGRYWEQGECTRTATFPTPSEYRLSSTSGRRRSVVKPTTEFFSILPVTGLFSLDA